MKTEELLSKLTKALNCKEEEVPKGFKPRSAWQAEWKCSSSHAKKLLSAGIEAGLIECRNYRVKHHQATCITPHYGPTIHGNKKKSKQS